MVHVALKLHSGILAHPGYHALNTSEEEALACIPKRVYMFLQLLLGGQSILEAGEVEGDEEEEEKEGSTEDNVAEVYEDEK